MQSDLPQTAFFPAHDILANALVWAPPKRLQSIKAARYLRGSYVSGAGAQLADSAQSVCVPSPPLLSETLDLPACVCLIGARHAIVDMHTPWLVASCARCQLHSLVAVHAIVKNSAQRCLGSRLAGVPCRNILPTGPQAAHMPPPPLQTSPQISLPPPPPPRRCRRCRQWTRC